MSIVIIAILMYLKSFLYKIGNPIPAAAYSLFSSEIDDTCPIVLDALLTLYMKYFSISSIGNCGRCQLDLYAHYR